MWAASLRALPSLVLVVPLVVLAGLGAPRSRPAPRSIASHVDFDGTPPAGSTLVGPADPSAELEILFGLARDGAGLEAHIEATRDPSSPAYRDYRPVAEIGATYGATDETRHAFVDALATVGATGRVDLTGVFGSATLTVAQIETLFSVPMNVYDLPDHGGDVYGTGGAPTLPAGLDGDVVSVVGLGAPTPTPSPAPAASAPPGAQTNDGTPQGCSEATSLGGYAPNQLLTAYGVDALHGAGYRGQGMNISVVEVSGFDAADQQTFASCFGLDPLAPVVHTLPDGAPSGPSDGEAALDLQIINFVAPELARVDFFEQTQAVSPQTLIPLFAAPLDPANTGGEPTDAIRLEPRTLRAGLDDEHHDHAQRRAGDRRGRGHPRHRRLRRSGFVGLHRPAGPAATPSSPSSSRRRRRTSPASEARPSP